MSGLISLDHMLGLAQIDVHQKTDSIEELSVVLLKWLIFSQDLDGDTTQLRRSMQRGLSLARQDITRREVERGTATSCYKAPGAMLTMVG